MDEGTVALSIAQSMAQAPSYQAFIALEVYHILANYLLGL